ncbi:MAG: hypothetical protein KJO29_02415 [Bacteroidia bacterium]|nr:hypothetical protein [Bacteroidia bacterium]
MKLSPFKPINITLFILLILISLTGCKPHQYITRTENHNVVEPGLISIISGGYGETKDLASRNAIQSAFKNILIYGVPESSQPSPMLGSSAMTIYMMKRRFFEDFLENGTDPFILKKKIRGFSYVDEQSPSTEVELLINLIALKQHLEENNIIR